MAWTTTLAAWSARS